MPERCPIANSLIQTKKESDGNKREVEKWKKEVDVLKQEIKEMKKDDTEKGSSISDKNESDWITDTSLSLLNQQQMTLRNFDAENPYFETCGIRISLRGQNHPESETIQHSLPSDLEHFNNLRREMRDFDKKIIIGGLEMNVHKDLLSARIPYFKNLLNSNWRESSSDIINLSCDDDPTIFEKIINWAYSGILTITQTTVQCLMKTASYLLIESIVDECYMFMRTRIEFEDAIPLLHFCRAIDYNKNYETLIQFIESNFLIISHTPEFLELSIDDLVNIMNRNSLNIDNDEQILDAVTRWIGKEENRRKLVPKLLKSVGAPRLSSSFLNDIIAKNKWIIDIPESIALINEAQEIASNSLISLKSLPWNYGHSLIFVTGENEYNDNHDDFIRVDIYNPITNEWNKGEIEYRKLHKTNAVIGRKIYFYGHFWDDEANELAEGTMVIYDTAQNQWQELPMPSLVDRRIASTGVIDDIIYSTGGYPDDYDWSKSLTKFDPSNPSAGWTRLADMRRKRVEAATCVLDGKFYVIGGHNGYDQKRRNDGECYDPATNKWTPIANMPDKRTGYVAESLGGEIYVIGNAQLTKYSPTSDTWTNLKGMKYGLNGILVSSGGALFACGRDPDVVRVERYDPSMDKWTEMASMNEKEIREWSMGRKIFCALPIPSSLPSPNIEKSPTTDKASE